MGEDVGGPVFRVLGPFEVGFGDQVVDVGGPRLRAVLALLVANAGHVVGVATFVEQLWGPHAPPDAARTVRTYASRLRKALAVGTTAELIITRTPGYLLRTAPDALDSARFESRAAEGHRALEAGQAAVAAEWLATALELWRGNAYGEFDGSPALLAEGLRLERLRRDAVEDRVDADLAVGMAAELTAELEGLTTAHPARERLWGQLMTALYRSGRQSDALKAFRRARQVLVDDFGVEPSPDLAEIHRRVLAQDPRLLAPGATRMRGAHGTPIHPAQLPSAVPAFTGRRAELAALDATLDSSGDGGRAATIVVSAVCGTAGVGKTALAVHWAHLVADRFPDGQLYVNLRGFDPAAAVTSPTEAVRGFLDALEVPAQRIPIGLDAQAALYRSLLADRRLLILLDNARDAAQVRPLLPGAPGCLVVITSRDELSGLVATEGARPLALDLPTRAEARELLSRRLGATRADAEPDAIGEIIDSCARLPLALAIVAARAAARPSFPLAAFATELRRCHGGLDALAGDDATSDARAVFSWSYHHLSPQAARLFRFLGLHPGPDIDLAAAASLAGQAAAAVRLVLDELTRTHLLAEHHPGRFTCHDLLRAYAAEQARDHETDARRNLVLQRVFDHYLHAAHVAEQRSRPHKAVLPLAPAQPGVTPVVFADREEALSWYEAEHQVLLRVIALAVTAGFDVHAWQLPLRLGKFFEHRGHWHDFAATQHTALDAARRLGNREAQAGTHRALGLACALLESHQDSGTHLRDAMALYEDLGDISGRAHTHIALSVLCDRRGLHTEALDHSYRSLALYRAVDDHSGQAAALSNIGWSLARTGDPGALTHNRQALSLHRRLGNTEGQAGTWHNLGYAHQHWGHHDKAITCYQQALRLFRDIGNGYDEADMLVQLADTHRAAGNPRGAGVARQQALGILDSLHHHDADRLRARILRL